MSEEKEGQLPINSLLRFPEIAQEVGYLIMYAANLEIWLLEMFKKFLRQKDGIAEVTFGHIDNPSTKLEIIYKICEIKPGYKMAQDLLETKERTLAAVSFRNACAHGNFGLSKEGKPNLTSNILNLKRGKPKTVTLEKSVMRCHVEALRKTIMLMRDYVGADLLIHHHGPVDGVPQASPETPFQASHLNRSRRKDRRVQSRHNPLDPFGEKET